MTFPSFGRTVQRRVAGPVAGISPVNVAMIGDSLTYEPLGRRAIQREINLHTRDVRFVGTLGMDSNTGGIVGSNDMLFWAHDGVSGNTIEQCTARVPAIAAALTGSRAPHVIIDRSGTNNVSALNSLSAILAAKRAHLATLRASLPNTWIVVDSIPTWRSGSASGASWQQKKDLRDAYVAQLPALCSEVSRCSFVDGYRGTAVGTSQPAHEISIDGVHCVEDGYRRDGTRVGRELARLMGITARRTLAKSAAGEELFVPARRKAQSAIVFADAANARVTWASDADFAPETSSIAFTCWVRFSALAPGVQSIFGMGATFASGYCLAHDGDGLNFYLGSGTPVFAGNAGGYSDGILATNTDSHIAVVCDRANGYVGLALNGKPIQYVNLASPAHPALNWNIAASTFYIGRFVVNGFSGSLKEMAIYKGASAPSIYELAAFAEQAYVDGIFWDGLSALYRLDEGTGSPAEATGATGTGTLNTATWGTW